MDERIDGRSPNLVVAARDAASPASPYPYEPRREPARDIPGEPAAAGGAARRGVRGLRDPFDPADPFDGLGGLGGLDPAARRTVTPMPEPPRPGPRRSAQARTFCLEPTLASVAVARRVVARLIAEWGIAIDVDTAILLTSELVANAVTHGGVPGRPVLLAVLDLGGRLHVEVHDPGGRGADGVEPKRPTADGESGRGLAIVAALADFWDWEPTGWGKVVYFRLSAASEARAA